MALVTRRRTWPVPVVGAALSAVLSSGVTAVWLRSREPETFAQRGSFDVAPEQRAVAALLVAPGGAYVAASAGEPVAAVAGLTALGFTRGWSRSWRTPKDNRVDVVVLEFATERGAVDYARGIGRTARLLVKPQPFTVTGVPGSSGLTDTVRDRDGHYARVVVLYRGTRAALLVFTDDVSMPGAEVVALARRQYAALAT